MAKKMMDKLKARIGIEQKGAKNGPGSAPKDARQIAEADGTAQGEAAPAAQKKAPAAEPQTIGACESMMGRMLRFAEQKVVGWWPEIYDDTDVCRVLGWRKRKLMEYWMGWVWGAVFDRVGMHIGTTGHCLRQLKNVPDEDWPRWAEENGLKRIERDDGIWTVRMVRRNPNLQMATVEVIATGELKPCRVRDARRIAIGEVFDCRMEGGRLVMAEGLNTEVW